MFKTSVRVSNVRVSGFSTITPPETPTEFRPEPPVGSKTKTASQATPFHFHVLVPKVKF